MHAKISSVRSRAGARSAFTLVELLVVIGIIALLISILLPSLSRAKESAKRVSCGAQLRQLCMAQIMYAGENRGFFMDVGNGSGTYNTYTPTGAPLATNAVYNAPFKIHYGAMQQLQKNFKLTDNRVFFCPANPDWLKVDSPPVTPSVNGNFPTAGYYYWSGYMWYAGQFLLTGDKAKAQNNVNPAGGNYGGAYTGLDEVPVGYTPVFPRRQGDKPFYRVLITDLTRSDANGALSSDNGSNHVRGGLVSGGFMPKGRGGANIGYMDGHVEWHQQDELGQSDDANKNKRQLFQNDGFQSFRYFF